MLIRYVAFGYPQQDVLYKFNNLYKRYERACTTCMSLCREFLIATAIQGKIFWLNHRFRMTSSNIIFSIVYHLSNTMYNNYSLFKQVWDNNLYEFATCEKAYTTCMSLCREFLIAMAIHSKAYCIDSRNLVTRLRGQCNHMREHVRHIRGSVYKLYEFTTQNPDSKSHPRQCAIAEFPKSL
ncbi:hypothetical protein ABEB36_005038 [Hypothenemus hampei]|uniref:Uncharacterized protein n=1 Tax=Hypothenemus hampei TaxID=57062 RepID=A0ABD1EXR7_HYPHA